MFQICQNAAAPERTRGLIVRRHHTQQSSQSTSPPATHAPTFSSTPTSPAQSLASSFSPSAFIHKRGRKLQWVFGDSGAAAAASDVPGGRAGPAASASSTTSPTSPQYLLGADLPRIGGVEPASPTTSADGEEDGTVLVAVPSAAADEQNGRARTTKLNRASTVSIMSGLEAPDWARNYYAGGERALDSSTSSSSAAAAAAAAAAKGAMPPNTAQAASIADTPLYQRNQNYKPPQRTSSRRAVPPPPPPPPPSASQSAAPLPSPPRQAPDATPPAPEERQGLLPESTRKLRNFFGQRPPSELITTHLTEFFPLGLRGHGGIDKVDRKLLSKQVRASIRRSMSAATGGALVPPGAGPPGRRSSTASTASRASRTSSMRPRVSGSSLEPFPMTSSPVSKGETSWEHQPEAKPHASAGESTSMSRFSGSSNGSASELLLNSSSSSSVRGGRSPRSSSGSVLDPPDESAEDANEVGGLQLKVPPRVTDSPESTAMMALPSSSSSTGDTTTSTGGGDYAETRSLASSLSPSYLDPHGLNSNRLSRRMSRMSGSSRLSAGAQSLWERRSRDSDVASVITVDEVTAELETRRASGVSWRASDSDEDEDDEGREDGLVQVDPAEDDEIESDFDDDMSDDDEFETDDIDEEPGTAKPEGESLAVLTGRTGSPF